MPAGYLSEAAAAHYEAVKAGLASSGIPFTENGLLVRGLDYYTRTVFEYVATGLDAAQNAVGGGGRYDGLAEALGGRSIPAVGFSLGIDRILLALGSETSIRPALDAYVVTVDNSRRRAGRALLREMRAAGLRADIEAAPRSVKAQFKSADRRDSRAVVVVGDEWEEGEVTIRDLTTGREARIARDIDSIRKHLGSEGP